MIRMQKESVLKQLRRHHYLMINGGGILITLCVLLAGGLEIWALLRDDQIKTQQSISTDVSQIADLRTGTIATIRNGTHNIELIVNAPHEAQADALDKFRASHGSQIIQTTPEAQPIWVMTTDSKINDDAWPALALAQNTSPLAAKIRDRNYGILSTYLYTRKDNYLLTAIAPWTPDLQSRLLALPRQSLIKELSHDVETTLLNSKETTRPALPVLHWLPVYHSPLTQTSVFRVATRVWLSENQRFGTLVFELPDTSVKALMPAISDNSACMIVDNRGQLVLPCGQHSDLKLLSLLHRIDNNKKEQDYWVDYQGGRVIRGWKLNAGDWSFIYIQSWKDILNNNRQPLIVILLSSCLIIFLTWFLLIMVKRRVLLPALRQSERVFESEQLSQTLINTAPVGLGLIGLINGKLLLRSPVMTQMLRRLRSGDYNLPVELIRIFRHQNELPSDDANQGPVNHDVTFREPDGSLISLSVSVTPVRYRNEDTLVAAFVDVTDKKLLEQRLLTAKEAADRASAAKSSFLAAMSHEIRTPLNAILGNLELLEYSALDSQRDRLTVIRHASDNLLAIISDVLDFSKIEAGEMHVERIEFDLADIITHSLAIFAPVAQAKGITLVGEPGNAITLPAVGDPTCIQQVLNNLLSNALKFTERGEVVLRLRVDQTAKKIVIETEDTGIGMTAEQQAMIFNPFSQADTTINRRYGGTGLGLALCMRLVNTMGGDISVSSEPDKGSLFRLTFPFSPNTLQAERPRFDGKPVTLVCADPQHRAWLVETLRTWGLSVEEFQHPALVDAGALSRLSTLILWGDRSTWHPDDENRLIEEASKVIDCLSSGPQTPVKTGRLISASVYGLKGLAQALGHVMQGTQLLDRESHETGFTRTLHVLVAEDNPVNARLFKEQLHLLGCHATLVTEGEQALQQLRQTKFDILLTDLSMPGMDGYTLARRARAQWPDLPIMAVTANATQQEYQACKAAGMTRVLTKPLLLAELKEALSGAVDALENGLALPDNAGPLPLFIPPRPASAPGLLGGRALPHDVQAIFEQTCADSLLVIEEARLRDDPKPILRELHSLSGAFGVFEMQSMICRINDAAHQVTTVGVSTAHASLDTLCAALQGIAQGKKEAAETFDQETGIDALLDQLMTLAVSITDPEIRARITALQQQLKVMLLLRHHG